ncbi:helix-turn-helix transcriptional regulator [Streptomyces sp. C1-2]|uniref:helix-turn-helix domain-containing protein n=1 Tax=Streptomyces sp. C1-2 TaxID=2720022 RepID=UPI0014325E83|nr:helix-turn-helix transcriptional regulator [Streptomyces sp. C1-2]NJP71940.1 helix-turn-helix transcriptional regulator [Streptomyces sp. C1-2]
MDTIVLKVDDFVDLAATHGHLTYEQQAAATGLGVGTLHRIRSGEPASSTAIARICAAYDVGFDDVFAFATVTPKRLPAQRRPARRQVRAAAA